MKPTAGYQALAAPRRMLQGASNAIVGLGQALLAGATSASPTPFNVPIGPRRRFDWTRFDRDAVDGTALAGVLSDRDAFRALAQQADLATLTVANVMRREVQTVTMSTPLGEAARLLIRNRINCLPVMDGSQLAGIVTTTDLLQTLATHGG
jgi:CBS domain